MLNLRSQSAMEYLMTYGWAILIIALVLGVLFQLGVFSIPTPKAQPGNCQVVRAGAGITQTVSLAGECQGLLPEYVTQFNGASSVVSVSSGPTTSFDPVTLAAWVYPTSLACPGIDCTFVYAGGPGLSYGGFIRIQPGVFQSAVRSTTAEYDLYFTIPAAYQWYFVVETYDGTTQKLYVNGVLESSNTISVTPEPVNILGIGACTGCGVGPSQFFQGSLANIQVYNASLSAAEVQALYFEGIGGAPVKPQNIVGWWPLNGNDNDYSGGNNNGAPTNVLYSSSWTGGYVQP